MMEPKVVSLELIPGHPKYLRLPSLSRSLIHSILPRSCQAMHQQPTIFSISPRSDLAKGAPSFTLPKQCKKKSTHTAISRPTNIRPNTSSYTYKKVYQSKPMPARILRHYYTPKTSPVCKKEQQQKMYYCEITLPNANPRRSKLFPKHLTKTDITFADTNEAEDLHNIPEVGSSMESSEYTASSTRSLILS